MRKARLVKRMTNKYESLPIGVSVYDKLGALIYMNKKALSLLMIDDFMDVKGNKLIEDSAISDEDKVKIKTLATFSFEISYNPTAGYADLSLEGISELQKHINVKGEKIVKNGMLEYYLLFYEDRTIEKKLELDLIQKNEQLSLAIEAGDVSVWDWNMKDNQVFVTENFFTWFKKDYHFLTQNIMSIRDYIHPHDRLILGAKLRESLKRREEGLSYEFRIMTDEQEYKWMRVLGNPIYNEKDVKRFIGVVMNIDSRKREKDRLREQERTMNALLENMIAAFAVHEMIYDSQGTPVDYRFTYVNSAYEVMVGRYKEELVGSKVSDVLDSVDHKVIQLYGNVAKYGKTIQQHEQVVFGERYFDTIIYQTKRHQFAIIYYDVTEKIQFEETIKHTEKMTAIGQLTGGIAHDFNNQLMIISSFSQLLQEAPIEGKYSDYVDKIYNATIHSRSIIKELLAFSKKGTTNNCIIDMNDLLVRVGQIVEYTFDKTIHYISRIEATQPFIYGDESLLENALINLCINAKDAVKEEKEASIEVISENAYLSKEKKLLHDTLASGHYVLVKIKDNGTGIKQEHLDKIFEPFFTTKETSGTGMGLAAVFGTVKRHQGGVEVETNIGRGTTISIYLPVNEMTLEEDVKVNRDPVDDETKTLLLVDDEEIICHVLEEYFVSKNFDVYTAPMPQLAINIYRELHQEIDLVVLDVIMPEMTGFKLLKHLVDINPKVKVIFLSGYSDEEALDISLRGHVMEFVEKPVNLKRLHNVIQGVKKACVEE